MFNQSPRRTASWIPRGSLVALLLVCAWGPAESLHQPDAKLPLSGLGIKRDAYQPLSLQAKKLAPSILLRQRGGGADEAVKAAVKDTVPCPVKWPIFSFAVISFLAILFGLPEMKLDGVLVPDARRCLAILVFVGILWGTEAAPLHIVSMTVPLLTVLVGALRTPATATAKAYGAADVAKEMCCEFFAPTLLLFLSGFCIGGALERQGLSRRLAAVVLKPFGTRPEGILFGLMFLGFFLSMWISNVPAAVLCTSLAQPIFEQLPKGDPFEKALLLGIAFGNNVGGMTTPIASPQNVVAFDWLEKVGAGVTFLTWMLLAAPFCSVMLFVAWKVVLTLYHPGIKRIELHSKADADKKDEPLNVKQWTTLVLTVATVCAWSFWVPLGLEKYLGAMGLVGIIPVASFFCLGILPKEDFNTRINWSVLILIGGGLSLGRLMQRSKLLDVLSMALQAKLKGASFWVVLLAVAAMMAFCGNFASSAVIAMITLPVIAQVGKSFGRPAGLIVAATLMNTGAMGLPVSSFPNSNSFAFLRPGGMSGHYLSSDDYVRCGGLITTIALPVMVTVGYATMCAMGY